MAELILPEDLARRLNRLAEQEHRPIEQVIEALLDSYAPQTEEAAPQSNGMLSLVGLFDMGPTDFSAEVQELRRQHYQRRGGGSE